MKRANFRGVRFAIEVNPHIRWKYKRVMNKLFELGAIEVHPPNLVETYFIAVFQSEDLPTQADIDEKIEQIGAAMKRPSIRERS